MYAIVEILGKQYKVQQDSVVKTDLLSQDEGSTLTLDSVLFLNDEGKMQVGQPFVPKASVSLQVMSHEKDKKITVFRYRRRKGYHRKQGHRQRYSLLKVTSLTSQ